MRIFIFVAYQFVAGGGSRVNYTVNDVKCCDVFLAMLTGMKEHVCTSLQFFELACTLPDIAIGKFIKERISMVGQLNIRNEKVHI